MALDEAVVDDAVAGRVVVEIQGARGLPTREVAEAAVAPGGMMDR